MNKWEIKNRNWPNWTELLDWWGALDGTGLEVSEIKIKIGIYVNILHCKVLMSEEWKGEVKHIVIDSVRRTDKKCLYAFLIMDQRLSEELPF